IGLTLLIGSLVSLPAWADLIGGPWRGDVVVEKSQTITHHQNHYSNHTGGPDDHRHVLVDGCSYEYDAETFPNGFKAGAELRVTTLENTGALIRSTASRSASA